MTDGRNVIARRASAEAISNRKEIPLLPLGMIEKRGLCYRSQGLVKRLKTRTFCFAHQHHLSCFRFKKFRTLKSVKLIFAPWTKIAYNLIDNCHRFDI
jgi:hypothetical protein